MYFQNPLIPSWYKKIKSNINLVWRLTCSDPHFFFSKIQRLNDLNCVPETSYIIWSRKIQAESFSNQMRRIFQKTQFVTVVTTCQSVWETMKMFPKNAKFITKVKQPVSLVFLGLFLSHELLTSFFGIFPMYFFRRIRKK